jgi:hypothetical protein
MPKSNFENNLKFKHMIRAIVLTLIFTVLALADYPLLSQIIQDNDLNQKKFTKEWKTIDSLDNNGLPKSALELTEKIYKLAKQQSNSPQILKAIIYRMKYLTAVEDEKDIYADLLADIDKEIETANLPDRHLLHSMKAELYWMYYQNNQYQILSRTNIIGRVSDDINTWPLDVLISKVIRHYLLSLAQKDSLFQTDMMIYDGFIDFGADSRTLQPTLYDFLASRAFTFFTSNELTLTRPADFFQLKGDFYFADTETFIQSKIYSSDSLSMNFHAVAMLKEWLSLRMKDKNIEALLDVDLNRLYFAHSNSEHPKKDTLYLNALKNLQEKFSESNIYAQIAYYIASYYFLRSESYNPKDELTFYAKGDKETAMHYCKLAIEKFPASYGAGMCRSLKNKMEEKNLSFKVERIIAPNEKFPLLLNYRNIGKAYVMIGQIGPDFLKKLSDFYNTNEIYKDMLKQVKVLKTYQFDLKGIGDYNIHSSEALLDGLPLGQYIVVVANNEKLDFLKNVTNYALLDVTGISYSERTIDNGSVEYYLWDRTTGLPLKGATVRAVYKQYDNKTRKHNTLIHGAYTTDQDGRCVIGTDQEKTPRNLQMEFSYGKDSYNQSAGIYLYYRDYQKTISQKTFLFTDRAIYRPGQVVFFKGILLNYDGEKSEIEPGKTVVVNFYDVNYQKIAEQTLTTNEYGSFNGSFAIPKGLINGSMQIYTSSGSVNISVEEYKRPKFQVELLPFAGNYILNDTVSVAGKAVSFAGSAISNAKVKYRIVRKPVWRGWWFYSPPSAEYQMGEGTVFSNQKGEFEIKFIALPDYSKQSKFLCFEYQIEIDVTDLNGETQSTTKSMLVGNTALDASLTIGEFVAMENVGKIAINTRNINGEFLPAKGEIKIYKLKGLESPLRKRPWDMPDETIYTKEEWNAKFPGNVYKMENEIRSREKEKLLYNQPFNTAESKELDLSVMKSWDPGLYVAETYSVDAFGNPVEWKNYFTLHTLTNGQLPDKQLDWFVPVKTTAEVGENAQFLIGSSLQGIKILFEIENKGRIIERKWLSPDGFQQLVEVPVKEEYKGNFSVHFTFVHHNRLYSRAITVNVPRTDKMLDISFETFRDKLLPGQDEEWKIKIKGKKGEKVAAEMLAAMYDASLDKFVPHNWYFSIYNSYYTVLGWKSSSFGTKSSTNLSNGLNEFISMPIRRFDQLNWFGFNYFYYRYYDTDVDYFMVAESMMDMDEGALPVKIGGREKAVTESVSFTPPKIADEGEDAVVPGDKPEVEEKPEKPLEKDFSNVQIRTNFNETAFFYPNLQTNEEGEILIRFKVPESLTAWKMLGFAHTRDLKFGSVTNELKTQKDLMVMPNDPRFLRQNDKIVFPVKISNISKNKLQGTARLELFDAISMKPIIGILDKKEVADKNFEIPAEGNIVLNWNLTIPDYISAVTYKVMAKSGNFSDGEQKPLPVLTNRMLLTESLPLPIRGNQRKEYELTKLVKSKKSASLKNFKLTLEFSSNPAWYAIQAIPYIMEYPYECYEQTFSRLYANTLASDIVNSSPKVREVFESWQEDSESESFLSNLEKNQELKSVLLEETPWVLQASDEQERKKRVGLLFDFNRMADELGRATSKLVKGQAANGGWPWFDGMPESQYITQHIVNGFGHLDRLGVKTVRNDDQIWQMLRKAIDYLDEQIAENYKDIQKYHKKDELEKNQLSYTAIHYLYGRSFFKDIEIPKRAREAYEYFLKQSEKYWLSMDLYARGMIALYLNRFDKSTVATDIVKSLREMASQSDELGMFWKTNQGGYYWYQAPIETQALMIEVFNEIAKSQDEVEALKVWLLKQKQTQDWKTTKATTEAIYALLLTGQNWLEIDEMVKIKLGDEFIDPTQMEDVAIEAGTGYFKKSWSGQEIQPEMGKVQLEKTDPGVAWGGLYWQYFEDLDRITPHETPLKLSKKLFVERITERGKAIEPIEKKTKLVVGDKVIVRIELHVDRDMEYVHMKDMRASGFEPINVFSQGKYQDGLYYYESTKDAATNFFMHWLPKGTYVFEYPLRVTHQGDFANGITTIQCMYAPEFTSHSEGIRVKVTE